MSNYGRVRTWLPFGGGKAEYRKPVVEPRIKAMHVVHNGYVQVSLRASGKQWSRRVHRLVLIAFVGPPPFDGAEGCHWDGDPTNNHVSNLRWGSAMLNSIDRERHGTDYFMNLAALRTHCPQGHAYNEANTAYERRRGKRNLVRRCRECKRLQREARAARAASPSQSEAS